MIQIILIGIFYLSFIASAIWAVVEFLIYLVKDDPFNWASVWCTIIGFVLMIVAFVMKAAYTHNQIKQFEKNKSERTIKWGSDRSKKLEEIKQHYNKK